MALVVVFDSRKAKSAAVAGPRLASRGRQEWGEPSRVCQLETNWVNSRELFSLSQREKMKWKEQTDGNMRIWCESKLKFSISAQLTFAEFCFKRMLTFSFCWLNVNVHVVWNSPQKRSWSMDIVADWQWQSFSGHWTGLSIDGFLVHRADQTIIVIMLFLRIQHNTPQKRVTVSGMSDFSCDFWFAKSQTKSSISRQSSNRTLNRKVIRVVKLKFLQALSYKWATSRTIEDWDVALQKVFLFL